MQKRRYLRPVDYGGNVVDLITGRKNGLLPPKVRKFIEQHGGETVVAVRCCRSPISVSGILNLVTGGNYRKVLEEHNIDDLFHLWTEVKTRENGRYVFEKNAVINAYIAKASGQNDKNVTSYQSTQNGKVHTIAEMMQNTADYMGDKFTPYDGQNNNCQDFTIALLKSNGWGNEGLYKWVKQDTNAILNTFPDLLKKIMNIATETQGHIDAGLEGQGIGNKKKIVRLANGTKAKIEIGIYADNPTNRKLNRVGKKYKKYRFVK